MPDYDGAASSQLSDSHDDVNAKGNLPICHYRWIGRKSYEEARQLQEDLALKIAIDELPPTLLLLEHPHTFT